MPRVPSTDLEIRQRTREWNAAKANFDRAIERLTAARLAIRALEEAADADRVALYAAEDRLREVAD